jgi:hypothetical protein
VEAEFGVGVGVEDVPERFAAQIVGPAVLAAFELADVVGVEGRLPLGALALSSQAGVDRLGQLLPRHRPP